MRKSEKKSASREKTERKKAGNTERERESTRFCVSEPQVESKRETETNIKHTHTHKHTKRERRWDRGREETRMEGNRLHLSQHAGALCVTDWAVIPARPGLVEQRVVADLELVVRVLAAITSHTRLDIWAVGRQRAPARTLRPPAGVYRRAQKRHVARLRWTGWKCWCDTARATCFRVLPFLVGSGRGQPT